MMAIELFYLKKLFILFYNIKITLIKKTYIPISISNVEVFDMNVFSTI